MARHSGMEKTFMLSTNGSSQGLVFKPAANGLVSPNTIPDFLLTLDQILEAKIRFIAAMIRTGWGEVHVKMFMLFFTLLEMSPTCYRPNGHKVIALYIHKSLNEWYTKNASGIPFNIMKLSDILMEQCTAEVNTRHMESEQVAAWAEITRVSTSLLIQELRLTIVST